MELGRFAGLIYTVILIVDCLFFLVLEWTIPREDLDYVRMGWDSARFEEVSLGLALALGLTNLVWFLSWRKRKRCDWRRRRRRRPVLPLRGA